MGVGVMLAIILAFLVILCLLDTGTSFVMYLLPDVKMLLDLFFKRFHAFVRAITTVHFSS